MTSSENREKTCCFTGHRDLTEAEKEICVSRITRAVEALARTGITNFITGGALGFDTVAAVTVINLKRAKFPGIKITVAVPFRGQSERWSSENKALYNTILEAADNVVVLSENYHSRCMSVRNKYMVDNSRYCLSYVTKCSGGSYKTSCYAEKSGLKVLNLAAVYWD